jgi:hypothetical protein
MADSESPTEKMMDVATFNRSGPLLRGIFWIIVATALLAAVLYQNVGQLVNLVLCLLSASLGLQWLFLASRNCYLRAGQSGIAIRLPKTFIPFVWYHLPTEFLAWSDVGAIDASYRFPACLVIYPSVHRKTPEATESDLIKGDLKAMRHQRWLRPFYFKEDIRAIRDRLLNIGEAAPDHDPAIERKI